VENGKKNTPAHSEANRSEPEQEMENKNEACRGKMKLKKAAHNLLPHSGILTQLGKFVFSTFWQICLYFYIQI